MKIALVLAPFLYKRCPLIGLAYLSSTLKEKGHEVEVFDLNADLDALSAGGESAWDEEAFAAGFFSRNRSYFEAQVENILNSGSSIIGFSTWTSNRHVSLLLAEMIKQKDKSKLIVLGGPECSFRKEEFIQNRFVDVVVLGEAELTLEEIARTYAVHGKIDFCSGTWLKTGSGPLDCGLRPEIKDLNTLVFPDFSGFKLDKYYFRNTLPIMFNRGCLRHCVFCNTVLTWKKCRSRSAENIFGEMLFQKEKFPLLCRLEVDDSALNIDLAVLGGLCVLIKNSDLRISWGGSAIIHPQMDYALLKEMAAAGCSCLSFGLESGSQKIVDSMKKGFRIQDAQRLIRDTIQAGIEVLLNIVIGFPGETEYDFLQTMDFIKKNKDYIHSIAIPSECTIGNNTYLHSHADEFGVDLSGADGWMSRDGTNDHRMRLKRIEIFKYFLETEGVNLQVSKVPDPMKEGVR